MNIIGINYLSHDVSSSLINKKKIYAVEEERFTRIKHHPGTSKNKIFSLKSLDWCLKEKNYQLKILIILFFLGKLTFINGLLIELIIF